MALTSVLIATLALATGAERILLCRPTVVGDPSLARAEALVDAGRHLPERFLDYPVACQSVEEAARAAARAGLGHGIYASAEGQAEGAGYLLVLTTGQAAEVARRRLQVAQGHEAEAQLKEALRALDRTVPRPPPRWSKVAGWALMGAGVAALAGGVILASSARDQARRANAAASPGEYQDARAAWKKKRTTSGFALAGGGAAVAAGLTLELVF